MHPNEIHTDAALVRRLLNAQFPQWAHLPIERVPSSGTDNAIYRVGGELAARLPRLDRPVPQPEKEARWLPELAPHLPLPISAPVASGVPGEGYPLNWCVAPWFEGDDAEPEALRDLSEAARDLARFIVALHRVDAHAGPPAGPHNFYRGVPLTTLDGQVRKQIPEWDGMFDTAAITAAWDDAVTAPAWDGKPAWLHGDLAPGNILAKDGRICAVIDWGCLGVGDPAADLVPAWSTFRGASRSVFRAEMGVDDATLARGRGWALRAVGALPYYRHTNSAIVERSRATIAAVLEERASRSAAGTPDVGAS